MWSSIRVHSSIIRKLVVYVYESNYTLSNVAINPEMSHFSRGDPFSKRVEISDEIDFLFVGGNAGTILSGC